MPVLVIRHAHALSRSDWDGDDGGRTLSSRGYRQARRLVPRLIEMKPARIISSPLVRCVETVRPLAEAAGLDVEEDDRLAEGSSRAAVELLRARSSADAVLCSHGDVIPYLLAAVANEDRVDLGTAPRVEKASVWVLHGDTARFQSATYLKPPKAD
jgi:broad specificity phosphatase PhoE